MHLVTSTTVPPFHSHSLPLCHHIIKRPSHRAFITPDTCHNILPWHLLPTCRTCVAVRPGTTPCHHRAIVPPCALPSSTPWHNRVTWCTTVQPCHLMRHRAILSKTMPPWHRAAVPPPYRYDSSAYLCTPTHLTAVNYTFWLCLTQFYDIVCC